MSTTLPAPTHEPTARPLPFGLVAEFTTPEAVVEAAKRAYAAGYRQLEAYSPMPVDGLSEALGFRKNRVPMLVLLGGLTGGIGGFLMQYFSAVIHYPINIGGRPYNSWPSFMPVCFELTVLLGAFSAVFGMILLNGLPRLHHPIFSAPDFDRASQDRFFLLVMSKDPKYDSQATREFLSSLNPTQVNEVES